MAEPLTTAQKMAHELMTLMAYFDRHDTVGHGSEPWRDVANQAPLDAFALDTRVRPEQYGVSTDFHYVRLHPDTYAGVQAAFAAAGIPMLTHGELVFTIGFICHRRATLGQPIASTFEGSVE